MLHLVQPNAIVLALGAFRRKREQPAPALPASTTYEAYGDTVALTDEVIAKVPEG